MNEVGCFTHVVNLCMQVRVSVDCRKAETEVLFGNNLSSSCENDNLSFKAAAEAQVLVRPTKYGPILPT